MVKKHAVLIKLRHYEPMPAEIRALPIWLNPEADLLEQFRAHTKTHTFETLDWQISNHQHGVMFVDEQGKVNGREPIAAIYLSPMDQGVVADLLMGSVVLAGPWTQDGQVELLDKATAFALSEAVNDHAACRVMGGMYLTTELPEFTSCLPEWYERWLQR